MNLLWTSSGYQCGKIRTGGKGHLWIAKEPNGGLFVIRGVHGVILQRPILPGDSGSPVYNPFPSKDSVRAYGLGILFAREHGNPRAWASSPKPRTFRISSTSRSAR